MAPFDSLFCQEELFIAIDESEDRPEAPHGPISDSNEFLSTLITNEHRTHIASSNLKAPDNTYLSSARKEAIDWIKTTSSRFRFNPPLTVILAVNYLDRCFLSSNGLHLQPDKPWMKQLSAVACLSLAAKVEETHVPFLLDLQLSDEDFTTGFVFEPKTVRRMELLVLSTLNWRMSPVTPIAFIECILPELKNDDDDDEDDNDNVAEILRRCEFVLLSVLSDWRWVQFAPSVWAAAVILHSMDDGIMQQVLELLPVSKERVKVCYGVIVELMGGGSKKRKSGHAFEPPSPNGVSASCFSFDSSSSLDSWASSVSSSPTFVPASLKRLNCN